MNLSSLLQVIRNAGCDVSSCGPAGRYGGLDR